MLNFHSVIDGAEIRLHTGEVVTVVETLDITEERPTGMPYDMWAEVRASDGKQYRVWDNGEVDLIDDEDGYYGIDEERVGYCWALTTRYFGALAVA